MICFVGMDLSNGQEVQEESDYWFDDGDSDEQLILAAQEIKRHQQAVLLSIKRT